MNKYFLRGALEALLFSLPVPVTLALLAQFLPIGGAFLGSGVVALLMIWRFALPHFRRGYKKI